MTVKKKPLEIFFRIYFLPKPCFSFAINFIKFFGLSEYFGRKSTEKTMIVFFICLLLFVLLVRWNTLPQVLLFIKKK